MFSIPSLSQKPVVYQIHENFAFTPVQIQTRGEPDVLFYFFCCVMEEFLENLYENHHVQRLLEEEPGEHAGLPLDVKEVVGIVVMFEWIEAIIPDIPIVARGAFINYPAKGGYRVVPALFTNLGVFSVWVARANWSYHHYRNVNMLQKIGTHPGILRFISSGTGNEGREYLVSERIFFNLNYFRQSLSRIPMVALRLIFRQLYTALEFLHSKGIAHTAIIPEVVFSVEKEHTWRFVLGCTEMHEVTDLLTGKLSRAKDHLDMVRMLSEFDSDEVAAKLMPRERRRFGVRRAQIKNLKSIVEHLYSHFPEKLSCETIKKHPFFKSFEKKLIMVCRIAEFGAFKPESKTFWAHIKSQLQLPGKKNIYKGWFAKQFREVQDAVIDGVLTSPAGKKVPQKEIDDLAKWREENPECKWAAGELEILCPKINKLVGPDDVDGFIRAIRNRESHFNEDKLSSRSIVGRTFEDRAIFWFSQYPDLCHQLYFAAYTYRRDDIKFKKIPEYFEFYASCNWFNEIGASKSSVSFYEPQFVETDSE